MEEETWRQPPTRILPFREWLAVDDGRTGLAIAAKGIYAYEAEMNPLSRQPELYLTLVRGIEYMGRIHTIQREGDASNCHHTPGAQCLGQQVVEWSYLPYRVEPEDVAAFLPLAQAFLYPMMTHMVRAESLQETVGSNTQPISLSNSNIRFSACKRSHDGDFLVLRVYENQGRAREARIRLDGFHKAFLSNMNEEVLEELEVSDGSVRIEAGAYKVVTLLLC